MLEEDDENYVWDDSFNGDEDVLDVFVEPRCDDPDVEINVSANREHWFRPTLLQSIVTFLILKLEQPSWILQCSTI